MAEQWCDRPCTPAVPNEDSSEWVCDCYCHFNPPEPCHEKVAALRDQLREAQEERKAAMVAWVAAERDAEGLRALVKRLQGQVGTTRADSAGSRPTEAQKGAD